jgi:hypothetical protein
MISMYDAQADRQAERQIAAAQVESDPEQRRRR